MPTATKAMYGCELLLCINVGIHVCIQHDDYFLNPIDNQELLIKQQHRKLNLD